MLGEIGMLAHNVSVIGTDEKQKHLLIRYNATSAVPIKAALTMYGSYKDQRCAFRIMRQSAFLMSLIDQPRHHELAC
jgi:Rpp14/Pop5 family